jgi:hypothetical protein
MCEWEQECSDNPLLFNPNFARQYIKECQSWLINKQSMCAKRKLQLSEHLLDNQAQNDAPSSHGIHQQCHHFNQQAHSDSENDAQSDFPFQELTSNELINLQNALRKEHSAGAQNLINAQKLINTTDNEISLINEKLREPLLHIANKLLGRQNLNFDQLTTPEQKLWNLFEKSDIYEFLTGETDTTPEFRHNWITCSAKPKVEFDFQTFFNDWNHLNFQFNTPTQPSTTTPPVQHFLRDRKKKLNYRALHLGHDVQQAAADLKQKCKSMHKSVRKSAKAAVTKLAPPKPSTSTTAHSSPPTTSTSSWKFWSSK